MMYVLIALPLIAIIASVFFAIRAVKKERKLKQHLNLKLSHLLQLQY